MEKDLLYRMALGKIPGIGPVYARRLLNYYGEASEIFRAPQLELEETLSLGEKRAQAITQFSAFSALEKEQAFLEKYNIRTFFITDPSYPQRLIRCPDAPILLYFKGNTDLNTAKIIAMIGTRSPSAYGRQVTEKLIQQLAAFPGMLIISGLAYGIDAIAHQAALKAGIPTVGVLGHGLDKIYPPEHTGLAREMVKDGGLLTRFSAGNEPEAYNFPIRNRIVAGISDAIVVTETRTRGGSMLTVENAINYHRKVFAIPGRINDDRSSGCNMLIRTGKAQLLTDARQLMEESEGPPQPETSITLQGALFPATPVIPGHTSGLSDKERSLLQLFLEKKTLTLPEIHARIPQDDSSLPGTLLNLELLGHISAHPGKTYRLCE